MAGFWGKKSNEQRPAVSAEFDHALMREVMQTELVRVKALIITALSLLIILWTIDLTDPRGLDRIWRGRFEPRYLNYILIPFILFELWVHRSIRRHLRLDRDLALIR